MSTVLTTPLSSSSVSRTARRVALRRHPTLHGIDFVDVVREMPDGWVLQLSFIPKESGSPREAVPDGITAADISVRELWGDGHALKVISVTYLDDGPAIEVRVERPDTDAARDDVATYVLELRPSQVRSMDPYFAQATFSFAIDAPLEVTASSHPGPDEVADAEVNFLAKDYQSFRRLMLDHLALLVPRWTERQPSDLGIALVELLAYAGDYLSYYQDAVATEAYLGTARRRASVRRHARLLDYHIHEGCNSRVWVQIQVNAHGVELPEGTPLLTGLPSHPTRIPSLTYHSFEHPNRLCVFETMQPVNLYQEHNRLSIYPWGLAEYALEQGATSAMLAGHFTHLRAGDVLIFEEVIGPATGRAADANRRHRHAVRLAQTPVLRLDTLLDHRITEITWSSEDALPFRLQVTSLTADGMSLSEISVARGNVVLADSGRTIRAEWLPDVPADGPYRPTLRFGELTYRVRDGRWSTSAASDTLIQDPRAAMPAIQLFDGLEDTANEWIARRDLLGSDPFARDFVVESDNDGIAFLRFGDGILGQKPAPGRRFRATYRVHNGPDGDVGPETVAHIVSDDGRIVGVRNPLPAQGGHQPEPTDSARLSAPQAFRLQQSCVTPEDYAATADRHPEVQKSVGRLEWDGSWHVVRIYVDRTGHRPVDSIFQARLRDFLEPRRLAGVELDVAPPRFVPLAVRLAVWLADGVPGNLVLPRLIETFSSAEFPDGRRGFFHPANFTFGQAIFLSPIVATARQIPGVIDVRVDEFRPLDEPPRDEIAAGQIAIGPLQVARVDSDPHAPENGWIRFHLEGGQ